MTDNLIVFGGTGDLTKRKLIPAIYSLYLENKISKDFKFIAIGRREISTGEYKKSLLSWLENTFNNGIDEKKWAALSSNIHYIPFNFSEDEGYEKLTALINKLQIDDPSFYLAVAPNFFETIVEKLKIHDLNYNFTKGEYNKVIIEKPFGKDLKSAVSLNKKILKVFDESHVYRIDHYLGKEMIQSIMALRFSNIIFEPIWNNKYIDNVQITSSETVGVETRGGYYETSGALRDMFQNHMLQLLSLATMEPPVSLSPSSIHDEKIKVLKSIKDSFEEKDIICGQYINYNGKKGYREEENVSPNSVTETFIATKIEIDNYRWLGVPFYIRTGKRMESKCIQIVIEFKKIPHLLYGKMFDVDQNLLVINIQPKEGISVNFNVKKNGIDTELEKMKTHLESVGDNIGNTPKAYEKLLFDYLNNESTLFTRWDELEKSWELVEEIFQLWQNNKVIHNYNSNLGYGPKESYELLEKDGRKWHEPEDL
ncbi:MAG: glucose-6-phosphate dehydrogenase [Lachnospirales bacterium]